MAYRQCTKCTSINNYIGTVAAQIIVAAALGVFPLLAAAIAGAALAPAILIPILLAIIAYCRWWLYDRLICLGGDKCAVGFLIAAEPPDEKSVFDAFDTDYSINLLLADNPIGAEQLDVEKSYLPRRARAGRDRHGHLRHSRRRLARLHHHGPDRRGRRRDRHGGRAERPGKPDRRQREPGQPRAEGRHPRRPGHLGDDTAHEGWNELHPIKQAQKIGEFTGNWQDAYDELKPLVHGGTPLNVETYVKFWCEALGKVLEPGVVLEQQTPENQWEIHPLGDGCEPEEDPPIK